MRTQPKMLSHFAVFFTYIQDVASRFVKNQKKTQQLSAQVYINTFMVVCNGITFTFLFCCIIYEIFISHHSVLSVTDALREDFLIAEKQLDMLEDICEEQDFRNKCLKEQKNLSVYKAKKESELEKLKG